ncbi:hypothetical protein HAX54_008199 [Datura stramonium]|uniref:Uncharacterized protein n=1 Tax=Datura stramonium TaxID=4076 RepID=A0ABS8TDS4_DATST|nr:hypothetical protein [Datura stramonium]
MLPSLPKTRLKLVRSSGQSSVDTGLGLAFLLNVRMNIHSYLYSIVEYGEDVTCEKGCMPSKDCSKFGSLNAMVKEKEAQLKEAAPVQLGTMQLLGAKQMPLSLPSSKPYAIPSSVISGLSLFERKFSTPPTYQNSTSPLCSVALLAPTILHTGRKERAQLADQKSGRQVEWNSSSERSSY